MVRRPEAIKRQRRPVYPVQGVFLAEIRGKDDPLSTLDVTKYFACLAVNPQSGKTDRLDAAAQELTRAAELNPREGTPLIQLGEIYLEKAILNEQPKCSHKRLETSRDPPLRITP